MQCSRETSHGRICLEIPSPSFSVLKRTADINWANVLDLRYVQLAMYLINAYTLTRQGFFGQNRPRYAALSHVWDPGENFISPSRTLVTANFDFLTETTRNTKIDFCAEQARKDGLRYFWVDTCCLDPLSLELPKAINSMFRWYSEASVCYVYLADVAFATWEADFPKSRWFTRCWTLPELIAPRVVQFFSRDGQFLGDKKSLEQQILSITGVPARALHGDPFSFPVTERMSWAADRQTSRPEDAAYSLLGICNISMDICYGEGKYNATQRLEYEIRKSLSITQRSDATGMRLLVAGSDPLRMETAPVCDHLEYAVLSHTWTQDEVLFDDVRLGTAEQKRGYSKIKRCCDLAVKHGFRYVWIDTCCIDKSSSSELQEAICSMYKWYKNASICYVYLEDCERGDFPSFASSRWFTRGWTLQELIAPAFVEFYDKHWAEIGTKQSLCDQVAEITSIDTFILRGADPTKRSVAKRMSWASSRFTTRDEDEAYCLMGLFNVFMPTIYGEGKRAFLRLQEEIIKQTEDYSIFTWQAKGSNAARGIFAHSPVEFSNSRSMLTDNKLFHLAHDPSHNPPPAMSGRGLMLTLPLLRHRGSYLGWVSYTYSHEDDGSDRMSLLCIRLKKIQSSPKIFARSNPGLVETISESVANEFKQQAIYVLPSTVDRSMKSYVDKTGELTVHILNETSGSTSMGLLEVAGLCQWDYGDKKIIYPYQDGTVTLAAFRFENERSFVVLVGLQDNVPWCSVVTQDDMQLRGPTLDNLKYLMYLEQQKLYLQRTDRAEKQLSDETRVTAAIRIARSTSKDVRKFGLHIRLSESGSS